VDWLPAGDALKIASGPKGRRHVETLRSGREGANVLEGGMSGRKRMVRWEM